MPLNDGTIQNIRIWAAGKLNRRVRPTRTAACSRKVDYQISQAVT